jgi:tetratricopeptide (TPR) repeat protein
MDETDIKKFLNDAFFDKYSFHPSSSSLDLLVSVGFEVLEDPGLQAELCSQVYSKIRGSNIIKSYARIMVLGISIDDLTKDLDDDRKSDWYYSLAESEAHVGLLKQSKKLTKQILDSALTNAGIAFSFKPSSKAASLRGRIARIIGKYDIAIDSYQWLVDHDSDSKLARCFLGYSLFQSGEYISAIDVLIKDPNPSFLALSCLAGAYQKTGQISLSLDQFEKATKNFPDNQSKLNQFGVHLINLASLMNQSSFCAIDDLNRVEGIFESYMTFVKEKGLTLTRGTTRRYHEIKISQ